MKIIKIGRAIFQSVHASMHVGKQLMYIGEHVKLDHLLMQCCFDLVAKTKSESIRKCGGEVQIVDIVEFRT
jgi:hypothetical protein